MKERLIQVIKTYCIIGIILLVYALICVYTSFRIPCVFTEITGLACPGCGMTRMCLALLNFDIQAAFYYNSVMCVLLPLGIVMGIGYSIYFVRTGNTMPKWMDILCWIVVIILILFGIYRNIA